jgi:hypothetical protein
MSGASVTNNRYRSGTKARKHEIGFESLAFRVFVFSWFRRAGNGTGLHDTMGGVELASWT